MLRSIRWISSKAPSSPFWIACGALPQPRSRIALAAAIRAAGGVLGFRITAARTRSAVLVRPRASERISVSDLAICVNHFGSVTHKSSRQGQRCPARRSGLRREDPMTSGTGARLRAILAIGLAAIGLLPATVTMAGTVEIFHADLLAGPIP